MKDTIERIEGLQLNIAGNLLNIFLFAASNLKNPLPEIADEHRKAAMEAAKLLKAANRPVPKVHFIFRE